MYTILVTDENELQTSLKERIMQRSKLVDSLHFLVSPEYKELDMTDFTVTIEYLTPVSKQYHTETLTKSEELYKEEFLEYKMPFDTALTAEPGDIEVQLTFTKVDINEEGESVQYVRKTSTTNIHIVAISAWSDIIPDEALNALDQRLLKVDGQIKELEALNESYSATKADNIVLNIEEGTLTLSSNGSTVGNTIELNDLGNALASDTVEGLINVII